MEKLFSDFLEHLVFTDGIQPSDVIGWVLAGIAGIVAYKLIDHMQTSMERHNMLSAIEDGFSVLYDSVIAVLIKDGGKLTPETASNYKVMVRSVLHDDSDWQIIPGETGAFDYKIIDHQRYIHIRKNEIEDDWISTQALHEITLKARRIEKMYKGGIVKRIDLADMFRELVPLGTGGRMEFFAKYYSAYDADCLGYLIMQTVVSCDKYGNDSIVEYFKEYYNKHEEIHRYFVESSRTRKIFDLYAVKKFKQIVGNE